MALSPAERTDGLLALLRAHECTHLVLAGYLKLIPADVCRAFTGRIVNVHPALLPAFGGDGMYGHRVHEAVIRAGVRVSGATVHFVDEAYDRGPIIAQWPVPVFGDDTPETVAIRVLEAEHQLLPRVVMALVTGAVTLGADGRVRTPHDRITWNHFVASDASGVADAWSPAVT
jgi:folate-dependent phosphoribosylglycinamide formyltransferase PurN